ncbi:MAG TPA: Na+/H+ antiporter NhaA [Candidatus Nanopelagicales bacterium]|jgi:NhaA family Na+:H+ antiporter
MSAGNPERPVVLDRLPLSERLWVLGALRQEAVGGALLLGAAILALVWANSPWSAAYHELGAIKVGPAALQLHLTLSEWAADGLLAVFFFIAGLELKHELAVGSLSKPAQAALPAVAAVCGMVVPAGLYALTVLGFGDREALVGWGIPMATDIAFALAVLAVVGSRLPVALRAFLLTLAVVDDLGAILVIAVFYSHGFSLTPFLASIACVAAYAVLQRLRVTSWLVYVPLALATWTLVHASGIHATIAGISLGLLTRVVPDAGEARSPADRLGLRLSPLSAALCVPLFAFFSAGVTLTGVGASVLTEPVTVAVIVGLVIGKPIGIYGGSRLVVRFTRATLSPSLLWNDVLTVAMLGGIGFTVSLLISELAFQVAPGLELSAKTGVLAASVVSAAVASVLLLRRNRAYRALADIEDADADQDGIPDVYQQPDQGAGGAPRSQ